MHRKALACFGVLYTHIGMNALDSQLASCWVLGVTKDQSQILLRFPTDITAWKRHQKGWSGPFSSQSIQIQIRFQESMVFARFHSFSTCFNCIFPISSAKNEASNSPRDLVQCLQFTNPKKAPEPTEPPKRKAFRGAALGCQKEENVQRKIESYPPEKAVTWHRKSRKCVDGFGPDEKMIVIDRISMYI